MSWAALTSGGKDSILAVQKAIDLGHRVEYLVTVRPKNPDSFMFHTSNLDAVPVIAAHAGMACIEIVTPGRKEEEVLDLEAGLSTLPIGGIVTGAIGSRYQQERIDTVAKHLSLEVFSPLWGMDPGVLLEEVSERLNAIIVVVAAGGLDERMLGRRIDRGLIRELEAISKKHRIHIAGEGGEYETLALDAPFYERPLEYQETEIRSGRGRSELLIRGFR